MAHLILTGATGLVGSAALINLIARPASEVSKVTVLSRREVPLIKDNPRFETVILKDFNTYDAELLAKLKGAEGAIWAQGISITQVPRDEYNKITIDYPLSAAKAFSSLSENFIFVYVSGMGATINPGTFTSAFAKIKGEAELGLLDLQTKSPSLKVYSVRPAFIDHYNDPNIKDALATRKEPGVEKFIKVLAPVLRAIPNLALSTQGLGQVMVNLALGDGQEVKGGGVERGRILENAALKKLYTDSLPKQK